eukprot:273003_1
MMETYCGTKRTDEEDKIDHVESVHNALNSISLGSTHETNQDDNANVDNDESSDSYDSFYYLMVSLEAASLIKTLAIPGALLHIICEYGEGHIMECWECKKQDHVDDIEESLDASEDWIEPFGILNKLYNTNKNGHYVNLPNKPKVLAANNCH